MQASEYIDKVKAERNKLREEKAELLRVAEIIEAAYADGPSGTFHTRINELAGGSFADVLLAALDKARTTI